MVRWMRSLASLEDWFSRPLTSSVVLSMLPLTICIVYASIPARSPLLFPDSTGYMYFDPTRPIGYPTFLYVVKHLTGNYDCLRYLQLIILCLSVYIAAISLSRYFRQLLVPFLFEAGVLGHPGLVRLTDSILSDSLSACTFLLFIAAVFHFGRAPTLRNYGIVCLVFAVAITFRPVNVSMVIPALLLPLFFRQESGLSITRCVAIALFLAVTGWQVTPVVNRLMHRSSATSYILAVNLFHRTIFIEHGKELRPKECDSDFIEEITTPVVNYLKGVPSEFTGLFRFQYSSYVRFNSVVPGLVMLHNLSSESQTYPILMCYTLARYRQAPVTVLRDIAVNYWNLISNYTFISNDTRMRILTFLQSHPPVLIPTYPHFLHDRIMHRAAIGEVGATSDDPYIDRSAPWNFEVPRARPLALILALKIVQLSAATVSVLLVIMLLPALLGMVRDREMILLGLVSLTVQLNLLICAIADSAEPRFLFPVWSGLWLALICSLSRLLRNRGFLASPVGT
jgi:hypothetical protein